MKHKLSSSVRVSEQFNLENFVSIFIDDTDDIFPEFEINETPNDNENLLGLEEEDA